MEWHRYYEETNVRGLLEQAPFYLYLLDRLAPFIRQGLSPNNHINALLGGIHPAVTQPSHFIDLCIAAFPGQKLNVTILDQNDQALIGLTGDGFTPVKAQLENLPAKLTSLHLVICDYTLDFMTDDQISALNQTLPAKLSPFAVFMITFDDPFFADRLRRLNYARYGLHVEFRTPKKLQTLLSNFKMIYLANTDNYNHLAVFTHPSSAYPTHRGKSIGLYSNYIEGPFAKWLAEQPNDRLPSGLLPGKRS